MLTKILLTLSLINGITTVAVANSDKYDALQVNEVHSTSSKIVAQTPLPELENIAKAITVKVHAGEDRGSGILIAQKDNTYTVITNAHVTQRGDTYTIETADGIKHNAVISDRQGTENDLAILEFNSNNAYQVAQLGDSKAIAKDETVIAAGFPYDRDNLLITQGKISLLLDKPLAKGYQIGFSNETVQGMSGGLLLNAKGEVIGVLGKGKGTLLADSYNYQDGSSPTPESIEQMKDAGFSIPIANIAEIQPELASLLPGNNPDVAQNAQTEAAQKPEYTGIVGKVDAIAEQITVRIDNIDSNNNGSGIIVAKQGNTYYGITAKHVLCNGISKPHCEPNGTHEIVTPDGKKYKLDYQTVDADRPWLDIAIFSFESDNDYAIANIGKYQPRAQTILVSGFPEHNLGSDTKPLRLITGGALQPEQNEESIAKDTFSLAKSKGNDGLIYTNISYGGMSGGAVLDTEGRLIGINTGSENEIYIDDKGNSSQVNLGLSLGESILDVLRYLQDSNTNLKEAWLNVHINPARKMTDAEVNSFKSQLLNDVQKPQDSQDLAAWMNYGNQMWRLNNRTNALDAFEKVISIDPNYDKAYYSIGLAYSRFSGTNSISQEQWHKVLNALTKATEINPNPYYYWRYLGNAYRELNQIQNALNAYDMALTKDASETSKSYILYREKGNVLLQEKQYKEALKHYNIAVENNPNSFNLYLNMSNVNYNLKRYKQALVDCNRAIANGIGKQKADAYFNCGQAHIQLKENKQAIADYSQAIKIDPNFSNAYAAYYNRGTTYFELKQYQQALADFNRSVEIEPNFDDAYYNRGLTYRMLKQQKLALDDITKAITINPKNFKAYANRAAIFLELNQEQKAIDDYSQALILKPNDEIIFTSRGITYQKLQNWDLALKDYNSALKINSKFPIAIKNIGLIKYELNAIAEAKIQLLLALANTISSSAPTIYSAEIQLALAVTEYTLGNTESGLKFALTALQTDRNVANFEFLRGQLWGEKMIADSQKLLAEL